LLMLMVLLVVYEPSASWITSPGAALFSAACNAEIDVTTRVAWVPTAAKLGQLIAIGTMAAANATVPRANQNPRRVDGIMRALRPRRGCRRPPGPVLVGTQDKAITYLESMQRAGSFPQAGRNIDNGVRQALAVAQPSLSGYGIR